MTAKLGLILGVAAAALIHSPSIAGESAVSPKLTIESVDPLSPLVSASRGLEIADRQTTGAIAPAGLKLALAAEEQQSAAASQDVDLSLATGAMATGVEAPASSEIVLASMAPVPTPRPEAFRVSARHPMTAPVQRVDVKRAQVELVSDSEQPRKKRVFRYPGPALVGVYN